MNTSFSLSTTQSAVASSSQEAMPAEKPAVGSRFRFPSQAIHPDVLEGLRRETARLSRLDRWRFIAQYDPFDGEVIRLTLLGLEGEQEPPRPLAPRSSFERTRLVEQGIPLVRHWWRILGFQAFRRYFKSKANIAFSLDELEGDGRVPSVELEAGVPSGELGDLLADPTVGLLLARLRCRKDMDEGRAILLILELLEGEMEGGMTQKELYLDVQRRGYTLASFAAMRKWLTRKKEEVHPDLKIFLEEMIGGPPADRALRNTGPSSEGPVIFYFFLRLVPVSAHSTHYPCRSEERSDDDAPQYRYRPEHRSLPRAERFASGGRCCDTPGLLCARTSSASGSESCAAGSGGDETDQRLLRRFGEPGTACGLRCRPFRFNASSTHSSFMRCQHSRRRENHGNT